jgi:hypothetical protein
MCLDRALEVEVIVISISIWHFGLFNDSESRNGWQRSWVTSQVSKQGFLGHKDCGITGVKSSALVNAKDAPIHDIVRASCRQMALLEEPDTVTNAILDKVAACCEKVNI